MEKIKELHNSLQDKFDFETLNGTWTVVTLSLFGFMVFVCIIRVMSWKIEKIQVIKFIKEKIKILLYFLSILSILGFTIFINLYVI